VANYQVSVRREVWERLKAKSAARGQSISKLVSKLVEAGLDVAEGKVQRG